jgi:UDP-glucuronate 4-epimerase
MKKAIKEFLPMQPGDVQKTWSSIKLINRLTNFKPEVSIEEGVSNFVNWYLNYIKKNDLNNS